MGTTRAKGRRQAMGVAWVKRGSKEGASEGEEASGQ